MRWSYYLKGRVLRGHHVQSLGDEWDHGNVQDDWSRESRGEHDKTGQTAEPGLVETC